MSVDPASCEFCGLAVPAGGLDAGTDWLTMEVEGRSVVLCPEHARFFALVSEPVADQFVAVAAQADAMLADLDRFPEGSEERAQVEMVAALAKGRVRQIAEDAARADAYREGED